MTHDQISALVQIQSSLGELRNNATMAIDDAAVVLNRLNTIIDQIGKEQQRIADLLSSK